MYARYGGTYKTSRKQDAQLLLSNHSEENINITRLSQNKKTTEINFPNSREVVD